ncbi:transcriptional regulator, AsnC family [Lachnospiraceae bacterium KM106-2]|nr:transcriptional regulator, AsnC family [Lachnospiraceae bacterium KM106-2]
MDNTDFAILNILKDNSRATASEISKKVKLSIPAVSERIHKLEDSHIIEKYTVKVNRNLMNYNLMAIVLISLEDTSKLENFQEAILQYSEVLESYHIAGQYDYLLKLLVKDTTELDTFLTYHLKSIPGVKKTNTLIILSTLKETENRL